MARRTGLGKGLDALIPGGDDESPPESGVMAVPLASISPNPHQPRSRLDAESLEDLAASIREHGVIQPLIVMRADIPDRYILIAGERRLRAAQIAGLENVPVILRQASAEEQLELALIENVQRADLTPLETAEAYRQLTEVFNLTQDEVAKRVGKSRVTVTNTLRLLKLPKVVQAALADGRITEGHARALLQLPAANAQISALKTVEHFGYNVRQTEELVRRLGGQRPEKTVRPGQPAEIKDLEDRLRGHLGTKVNLRHGKKGGSLVIHYYSNEELDAIVDQLLKE